MTTSADNIAGAPISWGICEVPGWGYQLAPERVLDEMTQIGLAATEFGPDGFLPADPAAMAALLASRHLAAVGGFTPVVLHEPSHDPAPGIERLLDSYHATRAGVLVLSAAIGRDGYDTRPDLDEAGWQTLLANLDRLTALAAERGVRAVLHPHVGTMVERGDEVQRVLEGSAISLCLDTGHLLIGGTDPAELTRQAPDRIAHTHFKDVNDQIAAQAPLVPSRNRQTWNGTTQHSRTVPPASRLRASHPAPAGRAQQEVRKRTMRSAFPVLARAGHGHQGTAR